MLSSLFQIPPPTNPFSLIKQHKRFASLLFSSAHGKRKELNTRMHATIFPVSRFPKSLSANMNLDIGGSDGKEKASQKTLPGGLQPEPKHVAVIMDGNRRWALKRGLPVVFGHGAGRRVMKEIVCLCSELGVKVVTFYAFSADNWIRSQDEVDYFMNWFGEEIESDIEDYTRKGIRTTIIGDVSMLPKSLQKSISLTEEATKGNTGLHVMIALNYSGRQDILQATKAIAHKLNNGEIRLEDIDEKLFEDELQTKCVQFPNPDLVIRTSGEQRFSNFMLWQLANTELFFVEKLFPDFEGADFINALNLYQRRQL